MGLEQYPFHNPEIPTLTEEVPSQALELEPLYVEDILEQYNFGSRNLEDVKERLDNAEAVYRRMGESGDVLKKSLQDEAYSLGGRSRSSRAA